MVHPDIAGGLEKLVLVPKLMIVNSKEAMASHTLFLLNVGGKPARDGAGLLLLDDDGHLLRVVLTRRMGQLAPSLTPTSKCTGTCSRKAAQELSMHFHAKRNRRCAASAGKPQGRRGTLLCVNICIYYIYVSFHKQ